MLPRFHFEINWLGIFWQLSNTPDADEESQETISGAPGLDVISEYPVEDELASEPVEEHQLPIGFGRYPDYTDGEEAT